MARSLQEIQKLIKDNGIRMVDFKLTDIDGRWRHLSIPAERLTESIDDKEYEDLYIESRRRCRHDIRSQTVDRCLHTEI